MHEPKPTDIDLPATQPIDLTWLIAEALQSSAKRLSNDPEEAARLTA